MKDELGRIFVPSIITGKAQLTATIKPSSYWKIFPIDRRAHVMGVRGDITSRKVRLVGGGKQRIITIPAQDRDIFKAGDKIKIYPSIYKLYIQTIQIPTNIGGKVSKSQTNKQNDQTNN